MKGQARWVCSACHGEAEEVDGIVYCLDPECGVVRIPRALPERLPWEPEK